MNLEKDIINKRTFEEETLILNSDYFKFIFKKTEKIVCAVFYTTSILKDNTHNEVVIKETEDSALGLLKTVHASLPVSEERAVPLISALQYDLLELESKLRILHASGLLSDAVLTVFLSEIDSVQRSSNSYRNTKRNPILEELVSTKETARGVQNPYVKKDIVTPTPVTEGEKKQLLPNRRGRILGVLRDKGHASIKDISDIVKDCSEKTIQRELSAMIKDGIVLKKGERRWSQYSLIK